MKISIIQMKVEWHDMEKNLIRADELINSLPGADLYLLPEMFSSGFSMDPQDIADSHGKVLEWMKRMSKQHEAALCGTVAVEENGNYYNRMYFVKPDGQVTVYDKRHLFTFAGEDKCYKAGEKRVVVEWKGVRILLQTCYDLRFPVFSRSQGDYDMAVYLASWPSARHDVWVTLLKARAIENQCYVAGVNRVGDDPNCHYLGGSAVIDPYGRYIARSADETESATMAIIDMQRLQKFRMKFPVLEDRDK